MSYIVPVHRPSGVRLALKLNFLDSQSETVVVAKANRLEFYTFTSESGLTLVHTKAVYGYIILLDAIRPAHSSTDHLFVGTDRYQYFTCSWDAGIKQLRTEQSYVDQADRTLKDTRENDRCHIDPTRRYMTLELHDGIVTVIPLIQSSAKKLRRDSSALQSSLPGSLGEPVSVRIEEVATRASAFLHADEDSKDNPCLALLWEDNQDDPQLKILELEHGADGDQSLIDLKTRAELRQADRLDRGVSHLIPVPQPYGGFLLLGERSIAYTGSDLQNFYPRSLGENATIWSCWAKVDDTRWLLADDYGTLYFLMLVTRDGCQVRDWKLDELGQASKASCLVYLDEGFVFLGSHLGDSQVVRIQEGGVQVLQTFSNIAPILDLQIMDLGRGSESAVQTGEFSTGQARLVSCSGAWQDGSIRSIRSGVGMEELGEIGDIPLITDMWGLSTKGAEHDILLASFATETRVFKFDSDSGVEEIDVFCNVDFEEPTLLATNLPDQKLLQVSGSSLRISDLESEMTVLEWKPTESSSKITAASANQSCVIIVESGYTVHVFRSTGFSNGPTVSRTFEAQSQISDVAISELTTESCIISFSQSASVAVLDLNTLATKSTQSLGLSAIDVPRTILLGQLLSATGLTLLISMADGSVVTFSFDQSNLSLTNMARIQLGSEPVFLKTLPRSSDAEQNIISVFASCEQPSLIYGSEGRIIYSAINSDQAARVCPFDSAAYPGAIAVATSENLRLATIDRTRTTQLQTLPMGATVRCLAYHSDLKLFGMGTVTRILETDDEYPHEVLQSDVKLVDEVTFKDVDTFKLEERELVECITAFQPATTNDTNEDDEQTCLFIVGTSISPEEGSYSQEDRGRILVFSVNSRRPQLILITQATVRGACRSLATGDGMIIAGLVKVVALYSLAPGSGRGESHTLKRLAAYRTSTNPISLSVQPSTELRPMTVAIGDLMKSISIIEAIPPSSNNGWEMNEVARHFATLWTSAVAAVAEREWAIADMEGNLAMLRQNPDAYGDEARRLEVTGEMRLSEVVNKIVPIPGARSASASKAAPSSKGKERTGSTTTRAARTSSIVDDAGPLIRPQAFVATVEGSIYMLGSINPAYTDALLRVQSCLATKVFAPGYMPWTKYRAWSTEVREGDEPFRFVDGEMVENGLLNSSDDILQDVLRESGLDEQNITLERLRNWGEDLRRLY